MTPKPVGPAWRATSVGLQIALLFTGVPAACSVGMGDNPEYAFTQDSRDAPQEGSQQVPPPVTSAPQPSKKLDVQAWEILQAGAADGRPARKTAALAALGTIGPRRPVVRFIEAALADTNPQVREVAAATLGSMKSRRSIPRLKQALEDESPEVSFAAARALWEMGDDGGKEIFFEILAGDRTPVQGVVQNKLRSVREKLRNPLAVALIAARQGAGALLGPFALGITVAEEFARDRSAAARALSARLLAADRSTESIQQLRQALADKNWVVRAAAAQALGSSSRRDLIPDLRPLLNDDRDTVRYMAAASIIRLSGRARKLP